MRLEQIAANAVQHIVRRIIWLVAVAIIFALSALAAIYQFSAAGLLALEASYGVLQARLIVGAAYAALAVCVALIFWMQRAGKRDVLKDKTLASPREMQFIMLAEAVMLGYQLARKRPPLHQQGN